MELMEDTLPPWGRERPATALSSTGAGRVRGFGRVVDRVGGSPPARRFRTRPPCSGWNLRPKRLSSEKARILQSMRALSPQFEFVLGSLRVRFRRVFQRSSCVFNYFHEFVSTFFRILNFPVFLQHYDISSYLRNLLVSSASLGQYVKKITTIVG